jgi:hypothetical protein
MLKKEYPNTIISINNFALIFNSQSKYNEAEKMHRRTLELFNKVLGKKHPNTLVSISNLALVLDS